MPDTHTKSGRRPSLAILCKYGSVPNEGVLTKVFYLAKYLVQEGVDVNLLISSSNHTGNLSARPGTRVIDGVRVTTIKTPSYEGSGSKARIWSWFVFEFRAFLILLRMEKQDIYLASSPSLLSGLTVRLLARIRRAKYIFDVRDIWPLSFTEDPKVRTDGIGYRVFEWIERVVTRDAAWSMSSIPRLDLYNSEALGVHKPFLFFPICVDEDVIRKDDGPDFRDPRDGNRLVVGYSGSIGITNNLDPLIEAIDILRNDPRFLFKIVGKGAMLGEYQQRLKGCENVVFYDAVSRDRIWRFNEAVDVGYVSTHDSKLWRYGQSLNKLVEYMNNGIPVIMSYPDGGYRTMLNEAKSGVFVPANDSGALCETFESFAKMTESERAVMGNRAKRWISENRRYAPHVRRFYEAVYNACS